MTTPARRCHFTHQHAGHEWHPAVADPDNERVLHLGMAAVWCPGVREPRDLEIEVVNGVWPDSYLYVGSGDRLVLLCDHEAPKWRNGIGLTPDNARKLAAALVRMADQSEDVQ